MNRKKRDMKGENNLMAEENKNQQTPKEIIVDDGKGNKYTLGFTRKTIKRMVKNGFVLDTEPSHLSVTIEELLVGAFSLHHSGMNWEKIEPIFNRYGLPLFNILGEMFMKPVTDLAKAQEEKEETEENPTWETVY